MKKRISFTVLILLFVFSFTTLTFADASLESNQLTLEKFQELQEQGVIGTDVSYEYLQKINEEAKKFEKILEEDNNFQDFSLKPLSTLRKGDILITNSTSSSLIGHAAIALSSNEILHIQGRGYNPETVTRSWFEETYDDGWIRVYRLNDSDIASDAADWAEDTYEGSNAEYRITTNLTTTNETYCSKLVFQAYYYGGSKLVVSEKFNLSGIISPYLLPSILSDGRYDCPRVGDL